MNSLAEGFARGTYNGSRAPHHLLLPLNYDGVQTPGVAPTVITKGGDSISAVVGFEAFLDVFRPHFNTARLFGLVEFYAVDPDTEERTFLYGYNSGTTGTSSDPDIALAMATLTLKTTAGGVLRITAMESISAVNLKIFPPFTDSGYIDDLADYLTGDDGIAVGRDNTYPFAPISFTTKTSDALRKQAGL
jgi:hypothetical protein